MKYKMKMRKIFIGFIIWVLAGSLPVHAGTEFSFVPPKNISSKQKLPLKNLNFVRTKQGLTYLISDDGRYVFQGVLFDVWNGEKIGSIPHMQSLTDRIKLDYLGIDTKKMFTLDLGTGPEEVLIFSDPNCGVCHKLLSKINDSNLIKKSFKIHAVITPLLHETSMEKSKALAAMAEKDPEEALNAFINNSYNNNGVSDQPVPGIQYNLLVAQALSIQNFPFIINSRGRMHIGMPDDIYMFLLQ